MFGIKKALRLLTEQFELLIKSNDSIKQSIKDMGLKIDRDMHCRDQARLETKLTLSEIKTRFFSLGERMVHNEEMMHKMILTISNQSQIAEDLKDKLISDEKLSQLLDEFTKKQHMIFEYMRQLENLMNTTEDILEEFVPVKKVPKLPKYAIANN